MLRKFIRWLLFVLLGLCGLVLLLVGPIDKTPLTEQPFYQAMMQRLDTLELTKRPKSKVRVGWSRFNITPNYSMPLAGYTPKEKYESIHDSIYGGVIALTTDSGVSVMVSLDLLLFPPAIKQIVDQAAKQKNYFLYYAATHTHSSLGGWDASPVGRIALGKFHEEWVDQTAETILKQIEIAVASSLPSSISYWENDASEYVENRLDAANGKADGKLRGLKFTRSDSSRAVVVTYSAHATGVELLSRIVSGDYPSALVKQLEKKGYDFGLFMAGMVASHRLKWTDGSDFERIENTAALLSEKVEQANNKRLDDSIVVTSSHIKIEFGPSQLRISKDWKVRNWVFRSIIQPLEGELTCLQIGNVLMIGTPADFSGEVFVDENLESFAAAKGKKLIITSFNGNYTGYITADRHYAPGMEEEVMGLNWVGPYFGDYYTQMIKRIVSR